MSPATLLADLRHRGIELAVEGDLLRYRAPKGMLTSDLRQAIAQQKPRLLVELASEAAWAAVEAITDAGNRKVSAALALDAAGAHDEAEQVRAEVRTMVRDAWLPAYRRRARAEHALGRLPEADRFLVEDDDASEMANGYQRAPDGRGWVETAERGRTCVHHADRPLAPDDRLYCAPCRAETETAMSVTARPVIDVRGDREACPACGRLADDLTECGDDRPVCADCRTALGVGLLNDTGGQR